MRNIVIAWMRAARSLMRPDIFWHMLWPTLLAMVLWVIVAVLVWSQTAVWALQFVQSWPWVGAWFDAGSNQAAVLMGFAHIMLVLLLVPMTLLTAAILIAALALPLMLEKVAASDYPELALRHGGSQLGSIANSLWALLLFVMAAALSLPLWFVPIMGVALSIALSAWLNQRCYRYDVLMRHADRDELQRLPREQRGGLYAIGAMAGVLMFVPFVNLLVPALSGLAFVHYLLQALRASRGVEVLDKINKG